MYTLNNVIHSQTQHNQTSLQQLVALGFNKQRASYVLSICDQDVNKAIQILAKQTPIHNVNL